MGVGGSRKIKGEEGEKVWQIVLSLCLPHLQIKGSILRERERRKEVDDEEEESLAVLCCVTQNSK